MLPQKGIKIEILKTDTTEEVRDKIRRLENEFVPFFNTPFPAHKYAGKVKFGEDGLAYQKRIRNEWD